MKRVPYFRLALIALALLLNSSTAAVAQEKNPVVIALMPEATIDDSLVYLDQIAKVTGGNNALRHRIARLDVAELKVSTERTTVTANQVKFRLLLAGLDSSQFKLTGAKQTLVSESDEPITMRKILASADWAVRQKYRSEADKVTITPAKEIITPMLDVRPNDRVQFDAKLNSAAPRAGKARVDVSIVINGKTREVVAVHLDIALTEAFAKKGSREFGIQPAGGLPPAADPLVVLIKNRDLVKIVAKIGAARVEATGEAMQDGKLGEVIRVRNTESNRVVFGRVEANGTVTVEY